MEKERISHCRTMDLRYQGVEDYLNVPIQNSTSPKKEFERLHLQLYGFTKPDHPVEVVNIRLESKGETQKPQEPVCAFKKRQLNVQDAIDSVTVHFDLLAEDGTRRLSPMKTPVFRREDVTRTAGTELSGPALIIEDVSTVVVDPGWRAVVNKHGHLVLETEAPTFRKEKVDTKKDPVLLEVFNNLFMSVAEQMGITMNKVSHSTNIKERLDYSCALFNAQGDLIANAQHIPVHLGAMGETVRSIIKTRSASFQPGDVYLTNDPFNGGSHLPDLTVVTPVFVTSSPSAGRPRLLGFVASRGHHADIGGPTPGSMPPFSKSIDEEGVLIPDFKLVQDGRFMEEEIVELLKSGPHPARNIPERLSDLRAAVAANAAGARLINELLDQYGQDVVVAYMKHVKDNAASAMRSVLSEMPDGEYSFFDYMDEGTRIEVSIRIQGDQAVLDFEGTDPQVASNLNAPRAVLTAVVLYTFRTLISRPIPLNDGCLEPLTVKVPKGSLLDPQPPAAVVAGNVETSMRITDVIFGALQKIAAGQGTLNDFTFGNSRFGYLETIGGGSGAGVGFNGAHGVHTHMSNTRMVDTEVFERRYPVVIRTFALRKNSGGEGTWKGGDGLRRAFEFRESMQAAILSERRNVKPYGLHGAEGGRRGRNMLVRDGRTFELPGKVQLRVKVGDVIVIETPGGGGCNNPNPDAL